MYLMSLFESIDIIYLLVIMPPNNPSRRVLTQSICKEKLKGNRSGCLEPFFAITLKSKPIKQLESRSLTTQKSQIGEKKAKVRNTKILPQNECKNRDRSFKISKRIHEGNRSILKSQFSSEKKPCDLTFKVQSLSRVQSTLKRQRNKNSKAYESFSYQGNRDYNEDRILIYQNLQIRNKNFSLFAVFDGHGGASASEYLRIYYAQTLQRCANKSHLTLNESDIPNILRQSILEMERKITNHGTKIISGSCGTFLLICQQHNMYYAANVGDSRILFIDEKGHTDQITEDHKPEFPKEKQRILKNGGDIYKTTYTDLKTNQKIEGPWRTIPGKLSVSRTFGDSIIKKAKKGVIIAQPDIFSGKIPQNSTILLMSDGGYEKIQNFQFSYFFSNKLSLQKQLTQLGQVIKKRKTNDNVSIIAIKTNNLPWMKKQNNNVAQNLKNSLEQTTHSSTKSQDLSPSSISLNRY